jgi:CheY-like chemotaxis protein
MVLASGVSETARTLDHNMTETSSHQPSKTVLHPKQEQKILVMHVDDNEDFLIISKRHLEQRGSFQIETVSSVNEAKQKITQKHYDAIICDYKMTEKTGLDFLKELRDEGNDVPFIIFTGEGREEVAIEALNFGADRYFNKNETPEVVYAELVHSLIKSVKAKRAKEEVRSLAKFPSEDPNPVLRIAKDGTVIYANKAAWMYGCKANEENKAVVSEELKAAVVSSLGSGLTEEVEIEYGAQSFSFVVAPIPEEGYANIY